MPLSSGAADILATPATPTVVQNALGSGASITYTIVAINTAGQDGIPSAAAVTPANNAATPNNTISWANQPGVGGWRVLKNGNLLVTLPPGTTSYIDSAGSAGSTYSPATVNAPAVLQQTLVDGGKWTYSTVVSGLAVAASATDIAVLTGSATKVVRVTHVEVSGIATTIIETQVRALIRTLADTGGTGTAMSIFPHDQNAPGATATATSYTANPTIPDSANRLIRSQRALFNLAAPTAASESSRLVWDFGKGPEQAVVLRGVAQQLAVNLNGVTISGGALEVTFTFTEE